MKRLKLYKEYIDKHKSHSVKNVKYKGERLDGFINNIRRCHKDNKLEKNKIEIINKILPNFLWDPKIDQWNSDLEHLISYYNKFKTTRIEQGVVYKKFRIGKWVSRQRASFKNKTFYFAN